MGKYAAWLEHKGHRILYANYANISDEQVYMEAIAETEAMLLSQPKGTVVPTIVDVTNTRLSAAINERAKEMASKAEAAGIPQSPTAMVGLSGIQKAVVLAMQFLRQDLYIAQDMEEAKDWLVEQV